MFIIGAGRVGTALAERARANATDVMLLDRDSSRGPLLESDAPILVATRNDDLDAILDGVPGAARQRLVFVQNGMLRPWLAKHGLERATRGLLFFAVPTREAPISPGGVSPFAGPLADPVARWLRDLELDAAVIGPRAFANVELEKLVWNCALGLLCQAHDATVGEILAEHDGDLGALVQELIEVGSHALDLQVSVAEMTDRIRSYSASIPEYRGAVKEWPWRNGWFVDRAREQAKTTDTHTRLLAAVGR